LSGEQFSPSEQDDFIFVSSKMVKRKRVKHGYGGQGESIQYKPEEEEKEWASKVIRDQIISTISTVQEKELKDVKNVYLVLGVSRKLFIRKRLEPRERVRVFDANISAVLRLLSAEVLAYLNEEHNRLLISCPLQKLVEILERERYTSQYFQQVKRIGPLLFGEQVEEPIRHDAKWTDKPRSLVIYLIPNVSEGTTRDHLKEILRYLKESRADVLDWDDLGFVFVNMTEQATKELLRVSNFVFRVSGIPQGIVERIHASSPKKRRYGTAKPPKGVISSVGFEESRLESLPIICLMDSGANIIPPLKDVVFLQDGLSGFCDYYDGYPRTGHGTPIACLATRGEGLGEPRARIISYKVYADDRRDVVYQGFLSAIRKYSGSTRIFLSSINFDGDYPRATAFLNGLIQEKNICAVFSAGNISKQVVLDRIASGTPYPEYIPDYPVQQPAQAVSIIAVGAISKKESNATIARKDRLAPFSRCGSNNALLYQCPKPEVVQHGGNICHDGSPSGVSLESFDKDGNKVEGLAGTSFSAPLFAIQLAEIESKYRTRIRHAETLKAIALASSNHEVQPCVGFGETRHFCYCDRFHALLVTEGTVPLPDTLGSENVDFRSEITVRIPKYIERIELFLVHSDNNIRTPIPSLNTFLRVYAYKTGRETGYVLPDNTEQLTEKSHMKILRWAFRRRSMEGEWKFIVVPEATADMLTEHRRETTVRYGCAILVTAKYTSPRIYSLSEEMRNLMKHYS
jgi:hypothetical protein